MIRKPPQLAPATPRSLATMLILGGAALAIIGWGDLALFYVPPHFGDTDWEFGTISRTVDALPLCALSLVLIVIGIRARGGRRLTARLIAVVLVILAASIAALIVVFVRGVPVALDALGAQAERVGATAEQLALTRSGMKQAALKAMAFGAVYVVLFVTLAVTTWRNAGATND